MPGFTLGQHALGNADERAALPTDYLMAVALGSHMTFWSDLTTFTDEEIASARSWVDLYRTWRSRLAGFTYPLLADPAGGRTWTALQPWDRDLDRGMALVYRQDAPEPERAVPLRGVRPSGRDVVRECVPVDARRAHRLAPAGGNARGVAPVTPLGRGAVDRSGVMPRRRYSYTSTPRMFRPSRRSW